MYISLLHGKHAAAVEALSGPDPEAATKLVASPPGATELIGTLFPETAYGTPFTPDIFVQRSSFTDALEPLYSQIALKVAPPCVLNLLSTAIMYNSVLWVDGSEPLIVYETQRPNDRDAAPLPAPAVIAAAETLQLDADADHFVLTSAGSFNYGHFLVDDLPRLKALDIMRARAPRRRRIVLMTSWGEAIDRVRAEAVTLLAGVECRFLAAHRAYRLGPTFYASPVSFHPVQKNPAALRYLVGRVTDVMPDSGGQSNRPKRLYVARSAAHGRSLLNETEVRARLEAMGYHSIAPETLSFTDQVRLFAGAQQVVGQMGAAMTNILFSPAGTMSVHLAPAGWIEPFYWDLSVALDQRYGALYGEPNPGEEPFHLRDFAVDPDALLAALPAL